MTECQWLLIIEYMRGPECFPGAYATSIDNTTKSRAIYTTSRSQRQPLQIHYLREPLPIALKTS